MNGEKIANMAMVLKVGLIMQSMRAIMNTVRNTELELLSGVTGHHILVSFIIITFMEKVSTPGPIIEFTKENGDQTKCMERVLSLGQMEENTSVNMLKIKREVMENSSGLMEGATEVNG